MQVVGVIRICQDIMIVMPVPKSLPINHRLACPGMENCSLKLEKKLTVSLASVLCIECIWTGVTRGFFPESSSRWTFIRTTWPSSQVATSWVASGDQAKAVTLDLLEKAVLRMATPGYSRSLADKPSAGPSASSLLGGRSGDRLQLEPVKQIREHNYVMPISWWLHTVLSTHVGLCTVQTCHLDNGQLNSSP